MNVKTAIVPRTAPEPEVERAQIDRRIAWVLEHPGTSQWLRAALESAMGEDPLQIANDVEMLRHLLVPRSIACAQL